MIPPQGDCPSATRHIRPQPIVWMMAGYRVSPSGGAGSLYSRRKILGNIWGRKARPAVGRHPALIHMRACCTRLGHPFLLPLRPFWCGGIPQAGDVRLFDGSRKTYFEFHIVKGSVIVCGCFISTERWKIQPFFQFSPWRDPRLRHLSGYPFGTSRKKASTIFYNTA